MRKILTSLLLTFVVLTNGWADNANKLADETAEKAMAVLKAFNQATTFATFDQQLATEQQTRDFFRSVITDATELAELDEEITNDLMADRKKYFARLQEATSDYQIQWQKIQFIAFDSKVRDRFAGRAVDGNLYLSLDNHYFKAEIAGFFLDETVYLLGIRRVTDVSAERAKKVLADQKQKN